MRDSADLFERVLDELGIALLPPDDAVWCLVAAANELLGRSHPRQWMQLMARLECSPLLRTAGDDNAEVVVAELPITPELVGDIENWAAEHEAVLAGWPREGGFQSEQYAEAFVRRGEQLVARLQAELGDGVVVEYPPAPVRPPGVKLSGSHGQSG